LGSARPNESLLEPTAKRLLQVAGTLKELFIGKGFDRRPSIGAPVRRFETFMRIVINGAGIAGPTLAY
jgi:hypothetical protein